MNNLKALYTSNTDEWATPQEFFDKLDARHHFTLDPCATKENAKCKKFYTIAEDGLLQDWGGSACSATLHTAGI
jgi:site-specific DNA-methyltransferase (adenine-specific)